MRIISACLLLLVALGACSPNNVDNASYLEKHFTKHKLTGTFGMMDNGTGRFSIYNLSRFRDSAYSPASTFKIVNSLIGLQTGKISGDSMIIKWDGVNRWNPEWNQDLSMYRAFRVSSVPYYQEVARRIGKDTMEYWLNSFGYGALKKNERVTITTSIDSFWLDGSLRVTPDQQLGFAKKLYFNQLPGIFKTNHEIVKHAMLFESTTNYRLSYKTGTTGYNEKTKKQIGWVVGWIEENNHIYFFVLNLESPDSEFQMSKTRLELLKDILREMGFLEGKM